MNRTAHETIAPVTVALALAWCVTLAPRAAAADDVADGRAAIERFGCVRCHEVPGFRADERTACVACHQALARRPARTLARRRPITHFVDVPSLETAARRVRPEWLTSFLTDPFDVRPHLEESMPRLPISATDARAIVAYLASTAPRSARPHSGPAPDPGRAAHGREVFVQAGCPTCHTFGNVEFDCGATDELYRAMHAQNAFAPNLRLARERLEPATMLAWIMDPTSVDPAARMPRPELSPADALAVRDFLLFGEAGAPVVPEPPPAIADLSPLGRPVRFAEVRRIFGRSCVHCHAKTSDNAARGLGFAPVALDLSSWEGVQAGTVLPDGTRRSVLVPQAGGAPILLARLLRRHDEAVRDDTGPNRDTMTSAVSPAPANAPVGMPLGLPPVAQDDLRVIATWIAQGARR